MSMVNPTNFYYENKKQANINYNETVTQTEDHEQHITNPNDADYRQTTKQRLALRQYTWGLVNTENTTQSVFDVGITPNGLLVNNDLDYQEEMYTPNYLNMIQFTPYRTIVDNTISVYTWLDIKAYQNAGQRTILLMSSIYTTDDERWANYLGRTTWSTWGSNNQIMEDIENGNHGYIYTKRTKIDTVISINDTDTQVRQFNVQWDDVIINPNKTNYIFIYNYLLNVQEGQENGIITELLPNATPYGIASGSYLFRMQGEYINSDITYEIIDVPGLMFDVLTMPFTFISVAFNLTLFPYTPYQINISNLFLALIATLVFIFIIRKLLRR